MNFRWITDVDRDGFSITGFLWLGKRTIRWSDIRLLSYAGKDVIIVLRDSTMLSFSDTISGFDELMRSIPSTIKGSLSGRKKVFRQLNVKKTGSFAPCPICGLIALPVNNPGEPECLNCDNVPFKLMEVREHSNETEYIKACQLEFFATLEADEPVDFYPELDESDYPRDPNWKPLVTREEVLAYSQREYWD